MRSFVAAEGRDVQIVPSESLVSPRARGEWRKWKGRLEENGLKHETPPGSLQDTVGAAAYTHTGGIAAGVSRLLFTLKAVMQH